MSNVVFILGAGASKQAGAPLMADFLDVATDLLRSNRVDDKKDHFERVFSEVDYKQFIQRRSLI